MHPGYWVLRQAALTCPDASLFVRARTPSKYKTHFRHIDRLDRLTEQWDRWLFSALNEYNGRGSLIEFAINPRAQSGPNGSVVPAAICVGLFPGKHFSLERRLRQLAMLKSMRFSPSYVIQTKASIYAVYQLDSSISETRRLGISKKLAYLTDTALKGRSSCRDLLLPLPGFTFSDSPVKLIHPESRGSCSVRNHKEFKRFPDISGRKLEKYEHLLTEGGENDEVRLYLESLLWEASELGDARNTLAQVVSASERRAQKKLREKIGQAFQEPDQEIIPRTRVLPLKFVVLVTVYMNRGAEMSVGELAKLVYRYTGRRLNDDVDLATGMQGVDRGIISQLIELGYTQNAVLDFYGRTEHRAGEGKSSEYLSSLYAYELEKLRAESLVVKRVSDPAEKKAWEFIVAVCAQLEKTPLEKFAKVRGDVLDLDVLACHPLYEKQLIEEGKSPLTRSHIQLSFRNCHDPYWLGSEDVDDRKIWRFSVSRLREQGLSLVFASLTNQKN